MPNKFKPLRRHLPPTGRNRKGNKFYHTNQGTVTRTSAIKAYRTERHTDNDNTNSTHTLENELDMDDSVDPVTDAIPEEDVQAKILQELKRVTLRLDTVEEQVVKAKLKKQRKMKRPKDAFGRTMEEFILGSTKPQQKVIDHFRTVVTFEDNQVNIEHFRRVEDEEAINWFDAETVNQAMDILRKQFPVAAGLQGICSSGDHFLIKNHSFIQILRKARRYILISAWNMENGHVNVFDPSSVDMVISDNTEKRIANLMQFHNTSSKLHIHIIQLRCTVREEYSGVICVAIAVYILTGCCPGMLDLNDPVSIIEHMTNCLKNKTFSPLPCEKEDVKVLCFGKKLHLPPIGQPEALVIDSEKPPILVYEVTKEIELHCLCHRPRDEYMKPCNNCMGFFHEICIKRFGCFRGMFLCPDCVGRSEYKKVFTLPHRRLVFDAYVSYKCSDLWFVKQYLIPKLERGAMYNHCLAINERDFIAGHCQVDEIIEKLSLSRQCLVVVSQDFLHGTLKLFEWDQIVRHRWFSLRVILIDPYEKVMAKCGPISQCFKQYLQDGRHLEWKQDMTTTEETRFWNRIRQFLGVPLTRHHRGEIEPRFFNRRH